MRPKSIAAAAAFFVVLVALVFAVRFLIGGPEDTWLCVDGAWQAHGRPAAPPPTSGCGAELPASPTAEVPFFKDAHLARGEAGMNPDTWYLKYSTEAGEGMMEVSFAEGAECRVDGAAADCAAMNPPSGSDAKFQGAPTGGVFLVTSIDFTKKQ